MASALLLGASGLIGRSLLGELLADPRYERVVVLSRRPLDVRHPKLSSHVVDFDRRETFEELTRVDDVFSSIGTTRAKTASPSSYRKIDFDLPLDVARAALERGAKQLLLVSSAGADPASRFFYPRLKGELEQAASKLSFEAVHFFRPSLLLGERRESRPAEAALIKAAPLYAWLFAGPFRKNRPIQAEVVARAMVRAAASGALGLQLYEFDRLQELGGPKR